MNSPQAGSIQKLNGCLFWVLLFVLVIWPLPLGSNRGWAYLALSGLCLLLFACKAAIDIIDSSLISRSTPNTRICPGAFYIFVSGLWFLGQAQIQWPPKYMSLVSPLISDYYTVAFNALFSEDSFPLISLSLDSGRSLDEGLLTLACFAIIVLMGRLIDSRGRVIILCYGIIFSGVFQAVLGSLMTLSGKEYLLFTPKESYIGFATGTFVNRNHLAGYLEMTLALGIGLLLGMRKKSDYVGTQWRGIARLISQILLSQIAVLRCLLIAMVIGLLMTKSRMGNAAFFNALLITGGIAAFVSKQFRVRSFYLILISIVLIDILLLGALFDLDKVIDRLENTSADKESRDEVVQYILAVLPDLWLTGTGAGSFTYVFPSYVRNYVSGFYDHAHNDYLEIFSEVGVIGMLPLVAYVIQAFYRGILLLKQQQSKLLSGIGFAAVMTTVSLMFHSMVDFNLQIPANIVLFTAILALPGIVMNIPELKIRQ